jgi:hypothetical protein
MLANVGERRAGSLFWRNQPTLRKNPAGLTWRKEALLALLHVAFIETD